METFTVRLHRVTKDDAQYALDSTEVIFHEYDIPDVTALHLLLEPALCYKGKYCWLGWWLYLN
jgi:hypothetical protein